MRTDPFPFPYANALGQQVASYSTWADLPLSILQKATFGLIDWQAAAVGRAASNAGATKFYAHSQGTLIATGMMMRGMMPKGSSVSMYGPAANYFTAHGAALFGGYKLNYTQSYFDWVNVASFPSLNPLQNLSGLVPVRGLGHHMTSPKYSGFFRP